MVDDLILRPEDVTALDIELVFEAYILMADWLAAPPNLIDIYGEYVSLIAGKRAAWRASFYPDDFYDGRPDRQAKQMLPDAMRDSGNFEPMLFVDLQQVLERFCIAYSYRNKTRHAAPVEVW